MKKCCVTCNYSTKNRNGDYICGNIDSENYGLYDGGFDEGCEEWEGKE